MGLDDDGGIKGGDRGAGERGGTRGEEEGRGDVTLVTSVTLCNGGNALHALLCSLNFLTRFLVCSLLASFLTSSASNLFCSKDFTAASICSGATPTDSIDSIKSIVEFTPRPPNSVPFASLDVEVGVFFLLPQDYQLRIHM